MRLANTPVSRSSRPSSPRGNQPEAIAALAKGVEEGLRYQTLLGVTGSGKTFTMAKSHRSGAEAHTRHGAEQDARGPAGGRAEGVLPPTTPWCTSCRTTITTSPKPTSPAPIPTLKRTAPSTMRSTACAIRPRRRFRSGGMSSLWHRCPVSTLWATPSITAAWSSACGPDADGADDLCKNAGHPAI